MAEGPGIEKGGAGVEAVADGFPVASGAAGFDVNAGASKAAEGAFDHLPLRAAFHFEGEVGHGGIAGMEVADDAEAEAQCGGVVAVVLDGLHELENPGERAGGGWLPCGRRWWGGLRQGDGVGALAVHEQAQGGGAGLRVGPGAGGQGAHDVDEPVQVVQCRCDGGLWQVQDLIGQWQGVAELLEPSELGVLTAGEVELVFHGGNGLSGPWRGWAGWDDGAVLEGSQMIGDTRKAVKVGSRMAGVASLRIGDNCAAFMEKHRISRGDR